MNPRERQYLKALIDSGALSFKTAAELEEARHEFGPDPAPEKLAWDLAVEKGLVTPEQSAKALRVIDGEEPEEEEEAEVAEKANARQELGSFELLARLGRGGMGVVYKARQKNMDRLVALKILPKSLARNQDFIERFLREARAAGRLNHPNIVLGIDAGFADGYYYFAMEYVDGRNLGQILHQEGSRPEKEALELGRQVAEALAYAHSAGIFHRDVKPENILVTAAGQAKLCDLGLARGSVEDLRITRLKRPVGTPYYIAPEQVRGEPPDHRADIYSLGCTLYHLIAGQPPFQGDNPIKVMTKHLEETAPRMSEVKPGVSRATEAVIEKMMAREPGGRYQSAREVAGELRKVAAGGIPAALSDALASRRRDARDGSPTGSTAPLPDGADRPRRARKGTGSVKDTTATRPLARGQRTGTLAQATEATTSLKPIFSRAHWMVIATACGLAVLGGVLGYVWASRRHKPPDETNIAHPPPEDPLAGRLRVLNEDLTNARFWEATHPKDYARIRALYMKVVTEGEGTEFAAKAREAIAVIEKRQQEEQSAARRAELAEKLEAIRAFEKSDPDNYAELLKRYEVFAPSAVGTEYETSAREAAEAVRKRRAAKGAEVLAALKLRVEAARNQGDFGAALAAVEAFPPAWAAELPAEVKRLREETLAAGRARWQLFLDEGRKLAAAGKYDEALAAIARGRGLRLPGLDAEIAAESAAVESARKASGDARTAAAGKAYGKFSADFARLLGAGEYEEVRLSGQRLTGKLTPPLEARLKADLAYALGAEGFIKEMRAELARAKNRPFRVYGKLGEGFFKSYDEKTDSILVTVEQGHASVDLPTELSKMDRKELVRIARVLARIPEKEELPPKRARQAACYLLAGGQADEVNKLLEAAKAGGEDLGDLPARLAALGGGGAPRPPEPPAPTP